MSAYSSRPILVALNWLGFSVCVLLLLVAGLSPERIARGEIADRVGGAAPLSSGAAYLWHTFFGSSGYDYGQDLSIDASGNIYVVGKSTATWGAPLHAHSGGEDILVMKLDSNGAYQWHTFYGGSGDEGGTDLVFDSAGNLYVTGTGTATWGAPLHAYTSSEDAFVLKLTGSGAYQWHTFYGGNWSDYGNAIAVDSHDDVYIVGMSDTAWGAPLHAHTGYSYDLYALKLNAAGAYQWHTFYGSTSRDYAQGLAIDSGDNLFVAGQSLGTWGTPLNAHAGSDDLLLLKLASTGAYQWHTFQGGNQSDGANDIAVNENGLYVTGFANSSWGVPRDFFTSIMNVVVLKFDLTGAYQWHTYYGNFMESGAALALDDDSNVYVTGQARSGWGHPRQAYNGQSDIYVLKLNPAGEHQWHTFYGSSNEEYGAGIAIDSAQRIVTTAYGNTTWGTPLNAHSGNMDGAVVKFEPDLPATTIRLSISANPATTSQTITFTAEVSPIIGTAALTGTVYFRIDDFDLNPFGTPMADGRVEWSAVINNWATGEHLLSAAYAGNQAYSSSTSPETRFHLWTQVLKGYLPVVLK